MMKYKELMKNQKKR